MRPELQPAIEIFRNHRPDWDQADIEALFDDDATHPPEIVLLALTAGNERAATPADCLTHPWLTRALAAADQLNAGAAFRANAIAQARDAAARAKSRTPTITPPWVPADLAAEAAAPIPPGPDDQAHTQHDGDNDGQDRA